MNQEQNLSQKLNQLSERLAQAEKAIQNDRTISTLLMGGENATAFDDIDLSCISENIHDLENSVHEIRIDSMKIISREEQFLEKIESQKKYLDTLYSDVEKIKVRNLKFFDFHQQLSKKFSNLDSVVQNTFQIVNRYENKVDALREDSNQIRNNYFDLKKETDSIVLENQNKSDHHISKKIKASIIILFWFVIANAIFAGINFNSYIQLQKTAQKQDRNLQTNKNHFDLKIDKIESTIDNIEEKLVEIEDLTLRIEKIQREYIDRKQYNNTISDFNQKIDRFNKKINELEQQIESLSFEEGELAK